MAGIGHVADLTDVGALEHVEQLVLPGLRLDVGGDVQRRLLQFFIAGRRQLRQGTSAAFSTNSHAPMPSSRGNGTTSADPVRRTASAALFSSVSVVASDRTRIA